MRRPALAILALVLAVSSLPIGWAATNAQAATTMASPAPSVRSANVSVFADGPDNPRGLKFGLVGLTVAGRRAGLL